MKTKSEYVRKKGIIFEEVDDLIHILDEKNDFILTLNPPGSLIWKALKNKVTAENLSLKMIEEFDVDLKTVKTDVLNYLSLLQKNKLIIRT